MLIDKEKQKEGIIQDKEVFLMTYQCPIQEKHYFQIPRCYKTKLII